MNSTVHVLRVHPFDVDVCLIITIPTSGDYCFSLNEFFRSRMHQVCTHLVDTLETNTGFPKLQFSGKRMNLDEYQRCFVREDSSEWKRFKITADTIPCEFVYGKRCGTSADNCEFVSMTIRRSSLEESPYCIHPSCAGIR
jgi:hypothetical protein